MHRRLAVPALLFAALLLASQVEAQLVPLARTVSRDPVHEKRLRRFEQGRRCDSLRAQAKLPLDFRSSLVWRAH